MPSWCLQKRSDVYSTGCSQALRTAPPSSGEMGHVHIQEVTVGKNGSTYPVVADGAQGDIRNPELLFGPLNVANNKVNKELASMLMYLTEICLVPEAK